MPFAQSEAIHHHDKPEVYIYQANAIDRCLLAVGTIAFMTFPIEKRTFSLGALLVHYRLSTELHCPYRFSGSWEKLISPFGQTHPSQPLQAPAYLAKTSTFSLPT